MHSLTTLLGWLSLLLPFLLARRWASATHELDDLAAFKAAAALAALATGALLLVMSALSAPAAAERTWWSLSATGAELASGAALATGLGLLWVRIARTRVPWARWLVPVPLLALAMQATPASPLVEEYRWGPARWEDDVCMQTTGFTCTAAAAATLLRAEGVGASESEMAARCATDLAGTHVRGLARGLDDKLPSRRTVARACRLDAEDIRSVRLPCIAFSPAHAFVILDRPEEDALEIGDPVFGRVVVPWEAFADRFTGVAVVLSAPREGLAGARELSPNDPGGSLRFGSAAAEPW